MKTASYRPHPSLRSKSMSFIDLSHLQSNSSQLGKC